MSQVNIRNRKAATYVGSESAFATTPGTMYRAFPVEGSVSIELEQKELDNNDERIALYDYLAPVRGMKDGKVKMDFYAKVPTQQMSGSVSPTVSYMTQILDAAWGSTDVDMGSVVQTSSTTTSLIVGTGEGANFPLGTWLAAEVSGALEPARVVAVSTDTLTVYPPFSAIPTTAGLVINSYTFAPDPNHTGTLTIQHAKAGDSSLQWAMSGSVANIGFEVKRNELMKITVEASVGTWQGPAALGLDTASAGTDALTSPFAVRDAFIWFRNSGTGVANRTNYCLQSFDLKTMGGMDFIECLGGTDGKASAFRKGERMFASATLKFRVDQDVDATRWTNQDATQCVVVIPKGSGTSKRFVVLDMPKAFVVGKPKLSEENGLLYMEVTLNASADSTITGGTTTLATAPLRLSLL